MRMTVTFDPPLLGWQLCIESTRTMHHHLTKFFQSRLEQCFLEPG